MTPSTPPLSELDQIRLRLDELLHSDPHLAQPIAYYSALSEVLARGPMLVPIPEVDPQAAGARLAAGQPLLEAQNLSFPRQPSAEFFRQVCQAVSAFQPGAAQAIDALQAGRLDLPALLHALLTNTSADLEQAAESAEVAPLTLLVLLEYTLRPTLRAWAKRLCEGLSLAVWQKPACPVCGSTPVLAELHKAERLRLLRCGICGAAWPYPLLLCAHCANPDPATQGLISDDDDPRYLAQTCKRCKTYIKTVVTPDLLPHDLLSLEDLASIYLDQGCKEKGFSKLS